MVTRECSARKGILNRPSRHGGSPLRFRAVDALRRTKRVHVAKPFGDRARLWQASRARTITRTLCIRTGGFPRRHDPRSDQQAANGQDLLDLVDATGRVVLTHAPLPVRRSGARPTPEPASCWRPRSRTAMLAT